MSSFFRISHTNALPIFIFVPDILVIIALWVKISLKSACGQEEVVQLSNATRGFDCDTDG